MHTAMNYTMDPDPNAVIPGSIKGTVNFLEAAAQEQSVRRLVLTSSSASALIPKPNNSVAVTTETWNDETVTYATRRPPYERERAYAVYAAAKTLAEREAWKFVREKKPAFTANAVLPNIDFGASLDYANQGHPSTSALMGELFKRNWQPLTGLPAHMFISHFRLSPASFGLTGVLCCQSTSWMFRIPHCSTWQRQSVQTLSLNVSLPSPNQLTGTNSSSSCESCTQLVHFHRTSRPTRASAKSCLVNEPRLC